MLRTITLWMRVALIGLAASASGRAAGIAVNVGDVFVANYGGGSVLKIDPVTGAQRTVGTYVYPPTDLALSAGGDLYVCEWGGSVWKIHLYDGTQTLVNPGTSLSQLWGLVIGPSGDLFVTTGLSSKVVRINPTTGAETLLTQSNLLNMAVGIEVLDANHLVVASFNNNSLVSVALADGTQVVVAKAVEGAGIHSPWGIALNGANLYSMAYDSKTVQWTTVPDYAVSNLTTTPGFPRGVSVGSDGDLWISSYGAAAELLRISPAGATLRSYSGGAIRELTGVDISRISVVPPNAAPVLAAIGNKTINEGSLLSFTATATDADAPAQTLTFSLDAGAPTGASITTGGAFTWTPTEGQGPSANLVTIRVSDGAASDFETIQIVVNEVNTAPVLAAIGNRSVNEGSLLSFTATATDADVPAQTLTFSLDAGAPTGASITTGGAFTWTPTDAQSPSTNLVTIRVSDGAASDFETIQIVVNEVNTAPVLAAIGNRSANEGSLLSFTATAIDGDVPAQTLTFSLDAGAPTGASITAGGAFTWTPTEAQGLSTNLVTIWVSDGAASDFETIQIVVNEVNTEPVLAAVGNKNVNEGSLLSFTVTATDGDVPAQTLTFSLDAGAPTGASITAGGAFTWTPTEAQGPSTNLVTIWVSDGAASDFETIQIVVNEVNTEPVLAAVGNRSVNEGSLLSFTVTATDGDVPAQTLTFSLDAGAPTGASITTGGAFTWTPTEAQGPSTNLVTIWVSDGAASDFETIQIVVNEVNTEPVLAAVGNRSVNEGSLLSFTVTATDGDVPAQTLTFSLDAGAPTGASITTGGAFTWTPTEAQGPTTNLVTIWVSDGAASDIETIQIVVNEVNTEPVLAAIGNRSVNEGSLLSFTVTATDGDVPAQSLTFMLDNGAPVGASITSGGAFTWTPTEAQGPSTNLVTIWVSDGAASDFETIQIVVNEVNTEPVLAAVGNRSINEGSLLSFMVTATDADVPAQTLTFSLDAGAPTGASITSGGAFTWTPTEAQGPSTNLVTIWVSDGAASDIETIQIVVNEVNTEPVLAAVGNWSVNEGSLLSFTVTATDGDEPAQTLTYMLDNGAPAGASITSGGAFTWTPTEGQGPSTNLVTIWVSDGAASDFEIIQIVVNEVNTEPVLAAVGNRSVNEGSLLSFMVTATDGDVPAQTLTFMLDNGAPAGTSITTGGTFNWTPTEAQGPSTNLVTIWVSDGAASDFETIQIVVNEVNTEPVLAAIGNRSVNEGGLLSFMVTATDGDVPAQTLTFMLDNGAPVGASITTGGTFNWTPMEAQGPSTNLVTIWVSDGAASDFETIQIVVNVLQSNAAPRLAGLSFAAEGGVNIRWNAIPGVSYQLQSQDRLGSLDWLDVGAVHHATSVSASIRDSRVSGIQRYYRVILRP